MAHKDSKESGKDNQKDDFESVAKRLECEDDKEAFEKKLGKIAKAKPKRTT
jgi:hypothetical protein